MNPDREEYLSNLLLLADQRDEAAQEALDAIDDVLMYDKLSAKRTDSLNDLRGAIEDLRQQIGQVLDGQFAGDLRKAEEM